MGGLSAGGMYLWRYFVSYGRHDPKGVCSITVGRKTGQCAAMERCVRREHVVRFDLRLVLFICHSSNAQEHTWRRAYWP